jgi:hypothetical protein
MTRSTKIDLNRQVTHPPHRTSIYMANQSLYYNLYIPIYTFIEVKIVNLHVLMLYVIATLAWFETVNHVSMENVTVNLFMISKNLQTSH